MSTKKKQAFQKGYRYGRSRGEATIIEAEKQLGKGALNGEVTAFCQGSVDGEVGDKWRYTKSFIER